MNSNLAEKIDLLPPGIYKDIPAAQYHALPYVSSSFLKKFRKNPAAALLPVEQTSSMILGSASHAFSLEGPEVFLSEFAVAPKVDKRTKAGKEEWELFAAANHGKHILTTEQAQAVFGMDNSLAAHPMALRILRKGEPELTLVWDDLATGLRCKARIDLDPQCRALVDYKTCADVSKFVSQAVALNYDIQAAHYSEGALQCGLGHDAFIFVACETSEPYPVRCGYLAPEWLHWAKVERDRLMDLVAECKSLDLWPNYEIPAHIGSIAQIQPHDLLEQWEMPKWR